MTSASLPSALLTEQDEILAGWGGSAVVVGIDLAWGLRNPDGWCRIEATGEIARVTGFGLSRGDSGLNEVLPTLPASSGSLVLLAVDAPLVCPNATGSRPVDRLSHRVFGRFGAGCHPANQRLCPRPVAIARDLIARGYKLDWIPDSERAIACEVFPHPALVRLLGLNWRIGYKRGTVGERRAEFARLQEGLREILAAIIPCDLGPDLPEFLRQPWAKPIEDATDAVICALIGLLHWRSRGRATEILGDRDSGFLLVPREPRTFTSDA